MRKCRKCLEEKAADMFCRDNSTKDGRNNLCKSCKKILAHEYNCSEKGRLAEKRFRENYLKTPEGQKATRQAYKNRILNHKKKVYARWRIHELIRSCRLLRKPCEQCNDNKAQAHHDNYDKPEEIRWLCQKCHRQFHLMNPNL